MAFAARAVTDGAGDARVLGVDVGLARLLAARLDGQDRAVLDDRVERAVVELDADRARLNEALAREDVRAALLSYGVDPAVVQKRVSSLTADEVQRMNAQMDQLPAGGDVLGVLLTIFIILLITDLIGWTSVFPFTKKGAIAN